MIMLHRAFNYQIPTKLVVDKSENLLMKPDKPELICVGGSFPSQYQLWVLLVSPGDSRTSELDVSGNMRNK